VTLRREDWSLFTPLRVRWAEVDRQDVVFNAHYFTYFDVAVTEYWRALGWDYPATLEPLGTDLYARSAHAEFVASARYDELLEIGCRTTRLGRTSLRLQLVIVRAGERGDELLTSGELVYVHAHRQTRTPVPWPEALRQAILRFERLCPEVVPLQSPSSPHGPDQG
jgi:acyl-CoA thioester hydrolase